VDVAATHDEAWRTAYQGIIPGNELDKLINRRGTGLVGIGHPQRQPHHILQFGEQIRRLRQLRTQPGAQPVL